MIFSKTRLGVATLLGVACAFIAVCCTAAQSAGEPSSITSFKLANGMQVVLIESHRVPAVTHMLWYKVGAADDYPGRSGLAHYNEHMMFQGTETVKSGEFARAVALHGGYTNAFTSRDYTAYYVNINKDYLPLVMQMEADRMLHLAPTEENFLKEREVIIEERRMTIDSHPEAQLAEEMQAALFRNHSYHNPIIGWMHEMQALSRQDVLAFHREFYHPANATLVVAGDITRAELEPLVKKYYAVLPAGVKYARHWRLEPPQRGARSVRIKSAEVREPQLVRTYTAPNLASDRKELAVPSFLMTQILGGGPTSRLYQSLVVRQKLAASVEADYDGLRVGPGQFEISATPARGVSLPQLEAALDAELNAMRSSAVADGELARAKVLLKAETIYARDGMEGMARTLGTLVMAGLDADYFNRWAANIDAVSTQEVSKAAAAVLNDDDSVTGYLLPALAPSERKTP